MKIKKFISSLLAITISLGIGMDVFSLSKKNKVSAATVTITNSWSNDVWLDDPSQFSPPSTITQTYTDTLGNTYNITLQHEYNTFESRQGTRDVIYESFGRNYTIDHTTLGYMSNNPTTYWYDQRLYDDPLPRYPSDYYGPPVDNMLSFRLVECLWDEPSVRDSFQVYGPGIYWVSDTGSGTIKNRYRKGVYLKYIVTQSITQYRGVAHYSRQVEEVPSPSKPNDQNINGKIVFKPNTSAEVSIKNNEWANKMMDIDVSVVGDTTKTMGGEAIREYNYSDPFDSTNSGIRSTLWYYNQLWEISELTITGQGTMPDGSIYEVNEKIKGTQGIISIPKEVKNLQLKGVISKWSSVSKEWISYPSVDPNFSSWIETTPNTSTNVPTETYNSISGKYNIDFTKPTHKINIESSEWTNKPIDVKFTYNDNFSGVDYSNSVIKVSDSSHYQQDIKTYNASAAGNTINLNTNGIYTIDVALEDIAGNKAAGTYKYYKFDKNEPYDTTYSNDDREYLDEELIVDVTCSDDLSGIAKVEYALSNSDVYNNEKKTTLGLTTNENSPDEKTSFQVKIDSCGSWYIHTWVTDRAGNTKYNISDEYYYFKIDEGDILVNPYGNKDHAIRGSRFDIVTVIKNYTKRDADRSKVQYTMPNWINDQVNKKENGVYSITEGKDSVVDSEIYDNDSNIELWSAFIPPYGTPLTKNMNGEVIGEQYEVDVQLVFTDSRNGPNSTKPITKKFNVCHEQIIKTQIIDNTL